MRRISQGAGDDVVGSFQQFLEDQAASVENEKSKAASRRDEWLGAVNRLNDDVRSWLAKDDPKGYLAIEDEAHELREVGIGTYQIPGLLIGLGPREVRLKPIARYVAGSVASAGVIHIPRAFGRVDLTNGLSKYMIFRVETDPGDRWKIIKQDGYEVRPLDPRSFEDALRDLLE
jgi:hypothetical protein